MRSRRGAAGNGDDRLTPQAFFNAAFKILGEVGHEKLTVDLLCARVGVTRGSFYHHFANASEFVARLLQVWEDTFEDYLRHTDAIGDLAHALEAAWPAVVNRPHEAEAALRSWAGSDPVVAAAVRRVDQKMETALRDALQPHIPDPDRRRVIAFMWTSQLVGMQQRPGPLDRDLMLAATLEFIRVNMGVEAEVDGDLLRIIAMPEPPRSH